MAVETGKGASLLDYLGSAKIFGGNKQEAAKLEAMIRTTLNYPDLKLIQFLAGLEQGSKSLNVLDDLALIVEASERNLPHMKELLATLDSKCGGAIDEIKKIRAREHNNIVLGQKRLRLSAEDPIAQEVMAAIEAIQQKRAAAADTLKPSSGQPMAGKLPPPPPPPAQKPPSKKIVKTGPPPIPLSPEETKRREEEAQRLVPNADKMIQAAALERYGDFQKNQDARKALVSSAEISPEVHAQIEQENNQHDTRTLQGVLGKFPKLERFRKKRIDYYDLDLLDQLEQEAKSWVEKVYDQYQASWAEGKKLPDAKLLPQIGDSLNNGILHNINGRRSGKEPENHQPAERSKANIERTAWAMGRTMEEIARGRLDYLYDFVCLQQDNIPPVFDDNALRILSMIAAKSETNSSRAEHKKSLDALLKPHGIIWSGVEYHKISIEGKTIVD